MRLARDMRPPGVYAAAEEPRAKPLTVSDTRVAGFVGVTARGPLDEPRLIGSWAEFFDIYGQANDSYLARSIEGFYLNGGKSCYVVRIAHRTKVPRRRPHLSRGVGAQLLHRAQGSARGVPRPAALAAVAPLRSAHH